jgi:hypothetical protein
MGPDMSERLIYTRCDGRGDGFSRAYDSYRSCLGGRECWAGNGAGFDSNVYSAHVIHVYGCGYMYGQRPGFGHGYGYGWGRGGGYGCGYAYRWDVSGTMA